MRTDLSHLPPHKQRELDRVVQIIFEEFEDALSLASGWKKKARIDKILLYGSYARGGWVDEPHTAKGYRSDFDILVMVSDKRLTDRATFWLTLEDRLNREFGITQTLRTPVNFIVHTLDEVNGGLAQGRYFFMDIARDAIALYQLAETDLHEPQPRTPAEALAMAQEYFDEWLPSALALKEGADFYVSRARLKEAAFSLHQATERLYHCVLLVVTFHSPHSHNLAFLRVQAERIDPRLADAWPRGNRRQRALFEKLKEAYIKARYSKHYRISETELTWLGEQVQTLSQIVETMCAERLAELATKVAA
jgi:uncharacterized protein